jgi:hypothetical protein
MSTYSRSVTGRPGFVDGLDHTPGIEQRDVRRYSVERALQGCRRLPLRRLPLEQLALAPGEQDVAVLIAECHGVNLVARQCA